MASHPACCDKRAVTPLEQSEFSGAFARSGAQQWLGQPALHILRELLKPGEGVDFLIYGRVLISTRPAVRHWLIALSSARLICIKDGDLQARRVIDVPLGAVVSVTLVNRIFGGEVVVATSHGRIRIGLQRAEAAALAAGLLQRRDAIVPLERHASPLIADPRTDPVLGASERDRTRVELLEETVDQLEQDLAATRQQVDFLEQLLRGTSGKMFADYTTEGK